MGVDGQLHAPAALPPGNRPGTHCIGGWVGPRAGLDGCEKSLPHRDSIPGPSSSKQVAIPTELSDIGGLILTGRKQKYWERKVSQYYLVPLQTSRGQAWDRTFHNPEDQNLHKPRCRNVKSPQPVQISSCIKTTQWANVSKHLTATDLMAGAGCPSTKQGKTAVWSLRAWIDVCFSNGRGADGTAGSAD